MVAAVVVCGGWSVYRCVEERSLLRVHHALMSSLTAGDFAQAYALTTRPYRAGHTIEAFRSAFAGLAREGYERTASPAVISFGPASAEVYAYEDPGLFRSLNGPSFFYMKEDGAWRFTGERAHYMD